MGKISLFFLLAASAVAQCVLVVTPPSATGANTVLCIPTQKFIGPVGPAGPIGPPGTSGTSTPPTSLPLGIPCPTSPPASLQVYVTFSDGTCGPISIFGPVVNQQQGLTYPNGTPIPVGATFEVAGFVIAGQMPWGGNLVNSTTNPNLLISATVQPASQ